MEAIWLPNSSHFFRRKIGTLAQSLQWVKGVLNGSNNERCRGNRTFPLQNFSYPKCLRVPDGRDLPALTREELSCLDSWLSQWFHLLPSLLQHICHWPRHHQRCIWRYRGARTKWTLVNCICIIGWQFHVATTQPPSPCHPEWMPHTFILFILVLHLKLISFYKVFPHYPCTGKEKEQTDFCTSRDVPGQDHHLFIGLSLNSFIWTNNSPKFVLCVIYSGRQISRRKEMDRAAKIFSISVPREYSCCMVAKHWIRE